MVEANDNDEKKGSHYIDVLLFNIFLASKKTYVNLKMNVVVVVVFQK